MKQPPMRKRSPLETASWIAGIAAALLALVFGVWQFYQSNSSTSATVTGNTGTLVITQNSPNATVVVNVPPPHVKSDQDNCDARENWVGVRPDRAEWTGAVPLDRAASAYFHGEFRWSPEINQKKQTTVGEIFIDIDGRRHKIYEWSSPESAKSEFDVPIGDYLLSTSGKFRIQWVYKSGTSGICVLESEVRA